MFRIRHNQEKYFYLALKKYRDEQLDALDTSPRRSRLVISASDHHHAYSVPKCSKKSTHSRSTSKFSVFHEEHLASKHSFFDEPSSETNYDPFRSSKQQSMKPNTDLYPARQIQATNRHKTAATDNSNAMRGSLRIEVPKHQNSKRTSARSRRSRSSVGHFSIGSRHSRTQSYASTTSLHHTSPVPIVVSRRHRRNVSFNHKRQASPSIHRPSKLAIGVPRCDSPVLPVSPAQSDLNVASSPLSLAGKVRLDNRAFLVPVPPTPRTRTLKVIELEARKVSNELEKVCNEAFFRSSPSAKSYQSSQSDAAPLGGETPPSSISNDSSDPRRQKAGKIDHSILMRPLPPTPGSDSIPRSNSETPGTYTIRELQAVRERLVHRYSKESKGNQRFFNDIVRQLDSLMPSKNRSEGPKVTSYQLSHDFLSSTDFLQAIPEEGRGQSSNDYLPGTMDSPVPQAIATHDYGGTESSRSSRNKEQLTTIRVVQPSSPQSPTPWAPLNIRKVSGASYQSYVEEPSHALNNVYMTSESYPSKSTLYPVEI
jgi:serine/threonine-protein kinase HSL1 (negative regulator of Swe1 kinase)